MTVSNVLRQRSSVTEETRQRVLRALEELNYIPVRTAVQNRHVAMNDIGVLFLQEMQGAVGYPTFLGIVERGKQVDHDLTILLRSAPAWVKPGAETRFLDRRCDGFIFVGDNRPDLSAALIGHKIPVVECYSVAPPPGVARVVGDNVQAMELAVAHMVEQGHTRLAHIAGPEQNLEARERRDGFRAAVERRLGPNSVVGIVQGDTWGDLWGFDYGDDPGLITQPMVEAILALDVTGVVCANDLFALALWKKAEEKGLRVPQDLSITGVDNIVEAERRGLTSVRTPFDRIGRKAVDALLALIAGASAEDAGAVLPVDLIKRGSVGPPPRRS